MKTETKPEDVTTLPLSHTAYPAAHQTIHPKVSDSISSVSTIPTTRHLTLSLYLFPLNFINGLVLANY